MLWFQIGFTKCITLHKSLRYLKKVSSNWPQEKQIITMNCRISTAVYFESRPLTSRPQLRKVPDSSMKTAYASYTMSRSFVLYYQCHKPEKNITWTDNVYSFMLILVFRCQQTFLVDIVRAWA